MSANNPGSLLTVLPVKVSAKALGLFLTPYRKSILAECGLVTKMPNPDLVRGAQGKRAEPYLIRVFDYPPVITGFDLCT